MKNSRTRPSGAATTSGPQTGRSSGYITRPAVQVAVLLGIVLLVYSNTFHSPFIFDDRTKIVDNSEIRDLGALWPPSGTRWLGFLSFALNYRFGGLDPVGYHSVNLAIHLLNTLLVYLFVTLTLNTPSLKNVPDRDRMFIAFFSTALFACHPIQTQAVTYTWQRITTLATLFYLTTLFCYARFRSSQPAESKPRSLAGRGVKTWQWYLCAILSAALAMKSKEIAFTLPFTLALYEFSFLGGIGNNGKNAVKRRLLQLLPFLAIAMLVPLGLFWTGTAAPPSGEQISQELRRLQLYDLESLSVHDYLVTQFRVIVTYLRLLLLPVNQNIDYDYPVYRSFFQGEVLASFLTLAALFSLAIHLYRTSRGPLGEHRPWRRLAGFGILWFFLTLSVESSIIPISDVIFEHRLYLPSIGFFLAAVAALAAAGTRWTTLRTAILSITSLTVLVGSAAAYARNEIWKDRITFWEDAVRKSPNKARPHVILGDAYHEKGRLDRAIEEYRTVLRIEPTYAQAHNNLGAAYEKLGDLDRAAGEYLAAIRLNPRLADAHNNLGAVYAHQGDLVKAAEEFRKTLQLKPGHSVARRNLEIVNARMRAK